MNYLSHFYHNYSILGRPLSAGEYYWGTILPDLVRVYDRNCRFRPFLIRELGLKEGPLSMWSGMLNHIRADDMFHRSDVFLRLQKGFMDHFNTVNSGMTGRQQRITAHLGVEFLLDHHFHTCDPGMTDLFYSALDSIPPSAVADRLIPAFPGAHGMADHIGRFVSSKFLTRYGDIGYLAEVLMYKMDPLDERGDSQLKMAIIEAFRGMKNETGNCMDKFDSLLRTIRM